jgi:hypothetical protein
MSAEQADAIDVLVNIIRDHAFDPIERCTDGTVRVCGLCRDATDHVCIASLNEHLELSLVRTCDCNEPALEEFVGIFQSALREKLEAGLGAAPDSDSRQANTDEPATAAPPKASDPLHRSPTGNDAARPPKPRPLPVQFNNIPDELKACPQWVGWRYEWRTDKKGEGKWTKPPYQPNGNPAKSTDPNTWSSFEDVRRAYQRGGFDGIGFVLTANDPYTAFDLDHCLNANAEVIDSRVANYVTQLNSYTERTPGGDGLRVIVRAKLPPGGRKKGNLECYDNQRYVTLTGASFPAGGYPFSIVNRQTEVEAIHAEIFVERDQPRARERASTETLNLDDAALINKARKDSAKFAALADGQWQSQGFKSQSEADLFYCSKLAYWTNRGPAPIDTLFRRSGLMHEKWNRDDYRQRTIAEAIRGCKKTYAERVHETKAEDILEEAADLPEVQFARKKKEFQKRLRDEAGWELSLDEIISEVRRRRQKRQSSGREKPPLRRKS